MTGVTDVFGVPLGAGCRGFKSLHSDQLDIARNLSIYLGLRAFFICVFTRLICCILQYFVVFCGSKCGSCGSKCGSVFSSDIRCQNGGGRCSVIPAFICAGITGITCFRLYAAVTQGRKRIRGEGLILSPGARPQTSPTVVYLFSAAVPVTGIL